MCCTPNNNHLTSTTYEHQGHWPTQTRRNGSIGNCGVIFLSKMRFFTSVDIKGKNKISAIAKGTKTMIFHSWEEWEGFWTENLIKYNIQKLLRSNKFLQQHGIDINLKKKEEGHREDLSASTKLCEVNSQLKEMTTRNGFDFNDNSHIPRTCLDGSKLHQEILNSSVPARNFCLRAKVAPTTHFWGPDISRKGQCTNIFPICKREETVGKLMKWKWQFIWSWQRVSVSIHKYTIEEIFGNKANSTIRMYAMKIVSSFFHLIFHFTIKICLLLLLLNCFASIHSSITYSEKTFNRPRRCVCQVHPFSRRHDGYPWAPAILQKPSWGSVVSRPLKVNQVNSRRFIDWFSCCVQRYGVLVL